MFELSAVNLWQYSLSVYGIDEVKDACLTLQDEMQLNVNVLLCMMFLSKQGFMFRFEDINLLEQAIEESDKALIRHRKKRRNLKEVNQDLYEKALADELVLEQAQQKEIVRFTNTLNLQHTPHPSVLSDQVSALCLRQITVKRLRKARANIPGQIRMQPVDNQQLSPSVLSACAALFNYAH